MLRFDSHGHKARSEFARSDAHAAARNTEAIYFTIGGQEYVARQKQDWSSMRDSDPDSCLEPAIGRIAIAGHDYVILNAEKISSLRDPKPTDVMTRREIQVAMLIADGKCDKEIARQLAISIYTVREHIRRIFAKLNVCRRTAIVSQILRI